MKRHKGLLIILGITILARVPIPGKTGESASLISRAVLAGYQKTICSNSHSVLEQTVRQVALGISCPNDKYQFSLAMVHNLFGQETSSGERQEPAKPKSHPSHAHKSPVAQP